MHTLRQPGDIAVSDDGFFSQFILFRCGAGCVLQPGGGFPGGNASLGLCDHLLINIVDGFFWHVISGKQSRPGRHEAQASGFVSRHITDEAVARPHFVANVVKQFAAEGFAAAAGTGHGEIEPFSHHQVLAKGEVADEFAKGVAFNERLCFAKDEVGGVGMFGGGESHAALIGAVYQMGKNERFASQGHGAK